MQPIDHMAFAGALKLSPEKALCMTQPLDCLPHPERLFVPLNGYRGQTSTHPTFGLTVKPGDFVEKGQALIHPQDGQLASIHAPLAATVVGLCERPTPRRPTQPMPCLELLVDPDQPIMALPADAGGHEHLPTVSLDDALQTLQSLGVVGQGGAQFPTASKFQGSRSPIHTLIINGVECEPYIACDEALMRHRPRAIVLGAQWLARLIGAETILLAFEDPMAEAMGSVEEGFTPFIKGTTETPEVNCVRVPQTYPQGQEQLLIKTLLGIELPRKCRPSDAGIVVLNVGTASSVYDALGHGLPLTHRIVSVTGRGIASPRNIYAPIGAPIHSLIERAGGLLPAMQRLLMGGPHSGHRIHDRSGPIDKGTLCILGLLPHEDPIKPTSMPCINCGFCVPVCPAKLLPQHLYKLSSHNAHQSAEELGLHDCIECGLCDAVCPSHLPLLEWFRHSKSQLEIQITQRHKADAAKQRFDARAVRLAEKEAQREAKRQRHEARLQVKSVAQSDIEAAISRAKEKRGLSS